jgi:hypothetical protein
MQVSLYQIRKDGYSEYLIHCPQCSTLFTLHESIGKNETANNTVCQTCTYAFPIEHTYYFICQSKFTHTFIGELDDTIPKGVQQYYMIHKRVADKSDEVITLNVYSVSLQDNETIVMK